MLTNSEKIMEHEFKMGLQAYISQKDIVEELRLLADSMSTHKALAVKIGISEQYLCDILKGKRNPGIKVCEFLKVDAVLVYRERK
jgi:DNA-binding XRE family transcriptional regulator